jgi:hypothetical protein
LEFFIWALMERGFGLLRQQQRKEAHRDQGSFWLISLFWYAATLFSLLDAWDLRWTTFAQSIENVQGLGILFVVGGLVIRFLVRKALGEH